MLRIDVTGLPDLPSAAAAVFHREWLGRAQAALNGDDVALVFAPADHTHSGWRLAAVQMLAREHAPRRVNAVASADPAGIAAALEYLGAADGITGQYLPLDSAGAGAVVSTAA
ncbi:MAG: Rossmann fold domain-containing protein [Novosphingobium sp.]